MPCVSFETASQIAVQSHRIVVIGTTGSGKTTVAHRVGEFMGYPHVELDALHWETNWTQALPDVFRERVFQALSGENWVVDGNYSKVRDIIMSRADTVVWLDYSFPVTLWQLTWRTAKRVVTGEELWNGNRESLRGAFFSRDSLFMWMVETYSLRRREYSLMFKKAEYSHIIKVRLFSPRQARTWLERMGKITHHPEMSRRRI